ncbi:hypothetical protein [Halomicrobium salinisoli]|uniref:hypothetical protein n=1 Tax=Halomicrobium salinisoli TaxID=2878391 RepID=UPI001CEFC09B|nr:hypothetical protein [Halomicrobium salinisoli]
MDRARRRRRRGAGPPRVYAVSVCLYRNRVRVRYAHPNTDGVTEMETTPIQHGDGLVPTGLAKPGSVWHRSVAPTVDAHVDGVAARRRDVPGAIVKASVDGDRRQMPVRNLR